MGVDVPPVRSNPVPHVATPTKVRRAHLDLRLSELVSHDGLRRFREQHGGDAVLSYRISRRFVLVDAMGLRAVRSQAPGAAELSSLGLVWSASVFCTLGEGQTISTTIGQDVAGTPLNDSGANFTRFLRIDYTVRVF